MLGFDGWFRVPTVYGDTTRAQLRSSWFDSHPRLVVDGVEYRTGPGTPLPLRLAILLPLALVFVGGVPGLGIGAVGVLVNFAIVRSSMLLSVKLMLMAAVLGSGFLAWLGLG